MAGRKTLLTRVTAAAAALAMIGSSASAAFAEGYIGDGVSASFDEAYYATVDYYGNLQEASVVKSYVLNGANEITDYGEYDEAINLTDGTNPVFSNGKTTFKFADGNVPSHFYFEGKTRQPYQNLPWSIAIHYTLNGVPTKAEDLAGKTGVVEINLDIVPNENASEYAKNNYVLTAMSMFNQDDILSLRAEGAQVQLVGNLRTVLFFAMPGEERHFTISVGTEDFSFGGLTFLMVPATLAQLQEFAYLGDKKDELESDYRRISGSLDTFLDSLDSVSHGLRGTAEGLDELQDAREMISAGKGQVYQDADKLKTDLTDLSALLQPVSSDLDTASKALTESKDLLTVLNNQLQSMDSDLAKLGRVLDDFSDSYKDINKRVNELNSVKSSLESTAKSLKALANLSIPELEPIMGGMSQAELEAALTQAQQLHMVHNSVGSGSDLDFGKFMTAILIAKGESTSSAAAKAASMATVYSTYGSKEEAYAAAAAAVFGAYGVTPETAPDPVKEAAAAKGTEAATAWATADTLKSAFTAADASGDNNSAINFVEFIYGVLLVKQEPGAKEKAESLNSLYEINEADPGLLKILLVESKTINETIEDVNGSISAANNVFSKVGNNSAALLSDLEDVIGDIKDLRKLLDAADDGVDVAESVAKKSRDMLKSVNELKLLADKYEPEVQSSRANMKAITANASDSVSDAVTFMGSFEELLKTSGVKLDQGTKDTLANLSVTLRATADSLGKTNDLKAAKNSIKDIIEETWNKYTGDVNNLLLMDANAPAQSITDDRNPAPSSVQILIRSQEIKVSDAAMAENSASTGSSSTLWQRIANMFKSMAAAVTGIFK
ncbi:MAG: hypothetical protein MJ186_01585 [Clostridia bacterium]|nr:hypothetical protein [Clostridia bacterium]